MSVHIELYDETLVPSIAYGLGTANAWKDTADLTFLALSAGYTHLDTAWHYKNARSTGEGMRRYFEASGKVREDVYVTYKGGSIEDDPAEDRGMAWYLKEGLQELGVDYVDLYLIHGDILVPDVQKAWKEMEALKEAGLARSIGVSNFSATSLRKVLRIAEIIPSVHQIEFHPYSLPLYEPDLLPLCKTHGIAISAYAPLLPIVRRPGHAVDPVVRSIASERNSRASEARGQMTEGQVLLAWAKQISSGIVVTTTTKMARMEEQLRPFSVEPGVALRLSQAELARITEAGRQEPYRKWGQEWPYWMRDLDGQCPSDSKHWPRHKAVPRDAHLQSLSSDVEG